LAYLGIADSLIGDMTAREYLHRLHPGVYAVGHTGLSTEARLAAALLYAGPGAMLSHATAAWWLGLAPGPADTISVTTARRCTSRPGVIVYDRRELQPIWHRQLRVAPVACVLLDFADSAEPEPLKRALAEAEYQGWLDIGSLKPWLRRGRPGSANLRRAIAGHEPRLAMTRSELERRLLRLCKRHGLPLPQFNVTIQGHLVDALWAEQRVVVEVDGHGGHATWAQVQRDRERDLCLRAAGFTVLRYGWRQMLDQPAAVAADLAAALAK
jgi:very-short-patch-repair endonuclease